MSRLRKQYTLCISVLPLLDLYGILPFVSVCQVSRPFWISSFGFFSMLRIAVEPFAACDAFYQKAAWLYIGLWSNIKTFVFCSKTCGNLVLQYAYRLRVCAKVGGRV